MLTTRKNLDAHLYSECETNFTGAIDLLAQAIHSTTKSWRFLHLYAGHIWIYLVAILVSIFAIYYFGLLDCPGENITSQNQQQNGSQSSKGGCTAIDKNFTDYTGDRIEIILRIRKHKCPHAHYSRSM